MSTDVEIFALRAQLVAIANACIASLRRTKSRFVAVPANAVNGNVFDIYHEVENWLRDHEGDYDITLQTEEVFDHVYDAALKADASDGLRFTLVANTNVPTH